MIKKYQVTLFSSSGKYRPVACIVNYEQENDTDLSKDGIVKKTLMQSGITKICQKRLWTSRELKKYEYNQCKIRVAENN